MLLLLLWKVLRLLCCLRLLRHKATPASSACLYSSAVTYDCRHFSPRWCAPCLDRILQPLILLVRPTLAAAAAHGGWWSAAGALLLLLLLLLLARPTVTTWVSPVQAARW
jgi:hypothetical protein